MLRVAKRMIVSLVLVGWLCLNGCHRPQGAMMAYSTGSITLLSTEFSPKSMRLVDLRTGETIFEMDIPVGQQLSFDFVPGDGNDPVQTPDLMRYQVWPAGTTIGRLRNTLPVPNSTCRRLEWWVRPTPEYAPAPTDEEIRVEKKT